MDVADKELRPRCTESLSTTTVIVLLVAGFTCSGVGKLPNAYRPGIIVGVGINLAMNAVSFFTQWAMIYSMFAVRQVSMIRIWQEVLTRFSWVPAVVEMIPSLFFVFWYYGFIHTIFIGLTPQLFADPNWLIDDPYILSFAILLLFFIPSITSTSYKYLIVLSYLKLALVIFIIAFEVYWDACNLSTRGAVYFWAPEKGVTTTIFTFLSAYSGHMLLLPFLSKMARLTYSRAMKVLKISMVTQFFLNCALGIVGYSTFGDTMETGLIFVNYPSANVLVITVKFMFIFIVIFAVPALFEPARLDLLGMTGDTDKIPSIYKCIIGFALMVIAIFLSQTSGVASNILYFLMDVLCVGMVFHIPMITLWKVGKCNDWPMRISSVCVITIGAAIAIYDVKSYFID